MPDLSGELLQIADKLDRIAKSGEIPDIREPLDSLLEAAREVGRAFSGSWQGYHAYVYYDGLQPPPPGAHFSQEWGLMSSYSGRHSRGEWREFQNDEVCDAVYELAGNPDLSVANKFNEDAIKEFAIYKADIISILQTELESTPDSFLEKLKNDVDAIQTLSAGEIIDIQQPKGHYMTRDTVVIGQGTRVPPHIGVRAQALTVTTTIEALQELAKCSRQAGSHLSRKSRSQAREEVVGTNVFIGHGQSSAWRELKDFVKDRLSLPVDEFNRVPVAGITNIARLSEMLDAASIAFLVMTGEDEQSDGKTHARMNVVHEAGLFQGRLGFNRAIVLLEEGCEEFSNIQGLGQIRFPKGNIKAAFEEVRQVLEREELIKS